MSLEHNSSIYSHSPTHTLQVIAILYGILALTWVVYQPAMPGFFMLDDFDNLGSLQGGVTDVSSLLNYLTNGLAGPLGRPISKLSFLLNDNAWPSLPNDFKRTNLLIHLIIGLLIFVISRQLLSLSFNVKASNGLALVIMAIWLTHPLHMSTVMYIIQRMTQLSGLFVMAGLAVHLSLRTQGHSLQAKKLIWLTISLGLFTLLAIFSKESGILLPLYILITEFTILSQFPTNQHFLWWRRIFIISPSVLLIGYLSYVPHWITGYSTREFTLTERLLTEPIILFDYLSHIFSMQVHGLGLFQDDYHIYSSLVQPATFLALTSITLLIVLAIIYRKRFPVLSFGVLWYFGGHLLESTTIPLELYFEHRNYVPMFGPLFAITVSGYQLLKYKSNDIANFSPIFALMLFAMTASISWGYAKEWGDPLRLITIWAAEHPESPRAQRTHAHLLASKGDGYGALDILDYAYKKFPYDLSIPIISIDISCRYGFPSRYNLEDLGKEMNRHRITDGLRPAFQSLFENILNTKCRNNTEALHKLVPELFNLQPSSDLEKAIASIYVLNGNLYIKENNGSGALTSFQIVDKMRPTSDSAIRLASMYMLLQDFQQARNALKLSQNRERTNKSWYNTYRQQEYKEKLQLIDKLEAELLNTKSN